MLTEIVVRFSVFGEHYYPKAKLKRLARKHPHEFGVIIRLTESGPREIEWIAFKEQIATDLQEVFPIVMRPGGKFVDFGPLSCEELAYEVAKIVARQYIRPMTISIEEMDEHCGASLTFSEKESEKLSTEKLYVGNNTRGEYVS